MSIKAPTHRYFPVNPRILLRTTLATLVVAGIGSGFTARSVNSDWYFQLKKPSWQPPGPLFGPVWTLLYVLMAVSGGIIWSKQGNGWRLGKALFAGQLSLNTLWSAAFFGLRSPAAGLAVITPLLAAIYAYTIWAWKRSQLASLLFVPYDLWTTFAAALNAWIFAANR